MCAHRVQNRTRAIRGAGGATTEAVWGIAVTGADESSGGAADSGGSINAMDCERQPVRESCGNFERAGSAQLYDRLVKRLALALSVLALAGCARDDGEADLPEGCTGPAEALVSALRSAPQPVAVGDVRIADCLARNSSSGDVQAVGARLLEAAQRLGEERDAVGLGYLVGALRRGAKDSQGIHFELVRRIEQEAAPFSRSDGFERGLRAGRSSG